MGLQTYFILLLAKYNSFKELNTGCQFHCKLVCFTSSWVNMYSNCSQLAVCCAVYRWDWTKKWTLSRSANNFQVLSRCEIKLPLTHFMSTAHLCNLTFFPDAPRTSFLCSQGSSSSRRIFVSANVLLCHLSNVNKHRSCYVHVRPIRTFCGTPVVILRLGLWAITCGRVRFR